MKREIKNKDQVTYVIPEKEFMQKLGIPEKLAGVYWSTTHKAIRVTCRLEKK